MQARRYYFGSYFPENAEEKWQRNHREKNDPQAHCLRVFNHLKALPIISFAHCVFMLLNETRSIILVVKRDFNNAHQIPPSNKSRHIIFPRLLNIMSLHRQRRM